MAWMIGWKQVLAAAIMSVSAVAVAPAQDEPAEASAIYLYQGADRDQRLLAGGRREGTLVLYTSLATTEAVPLIGAFERKYGVKVQLWRALSENILQRTIAEARARRHSVDVIETNSPEVEALAREGLIGEFSNPHVADLHPWALPPHRLWIGDRVDLRVAAFNTGKVRRDEIPATYEGFLDPAWKGRIAVEAADDEWLGAVMKYWGEDRGTAFVRRLAALKPDVRKGHVLIAQLVAVGEVTVALTAYSGNAESIKRKGGPVDWAPVEPLVGRLQAIALARQAPHPHAALLFADFLLSPEGMQLLQEMSRVPTSRAMPTPLDTTKYVLVDPAQPREEAVKWQRIWKELFLK
ncbi:MAG: extracellular solute-binding protein [Hyphomicrobiales bacterium]|nr:extracellular solute-binding protein [Hyphomicrobiales bacterium]